MSTLLYLRIPWIHRFIGFLSGSFPEILRIVAKRSLVVQSYIKQGGHRQNFPSCTTCQSFLFIKAYKSSGQACLFAKFLKNPFRGLPSMTFHLDTAYHVIRSWRQWNFIKVLAHPAPKVLLVLTIHEISLYSVCSISKIIALLLQ